MASLTWHKVRPPPYCLRVHQRWIQDRGDHGLLSWLVIAFSPRCEGCIQPLRAFVPAVLVIAFRALLAEPTQFDGIGILYFFSAGVA